jgi:hypothetical protein
MTGAIPRYAPEASQAFRERFHSQLLHFAEELFASADELTALVLGGGYGRGEGATVGEAEAPYNDVDLLAVARRPLRSWPTRVRELVSRHERALGIHFDLPPPLTEREIRGWEPCLMWFDLVHGHVVLRGPQDVIRRNAPPAIGRDLPAVEATRLLLNRGAGLLWASRVARGIEAEPDPDFVRRNSFKCGLALGDAVLIAHGRHATPYRGRDTALAGLAGDKPDVAALDLQDVYETALRFKFSPDALPQRAPESSALASQWGAVLLHVERRRTGHAFPDLDAYAAWTGIRETARHRPRHWLRNALRGLQMGSGPTRYPRELLFRQLPTLLGLTARAPADWVEESARFLEVWRMVN